MSRPAHDASIDATALLSGVLSIVGASYASAVQFEALARDLGLVEDEPMIQFLTGLRGVLSAMPVHVFTSNDSRSAVFTALQDALDAAIDREETLRDEAALAQTTSAYEDLRERMGHGDAP